jgi:hypothetical protein
MRTQAGTPEQGYKGKWSATFDTVGGTPGQEYRMSSTTSAPVFETQDEAVAGTRRALHYLKETGRFPNMCVPF